MSLKPTDPDQQELADAEAREDRAAWLYSERDAEPPALEDWDNYGQPDSLFR